MIAGQLFYDYLKYELEIDNANILAVKPLEYPIGSYSVKYSSKTEKGYLNISNLELLDFIYRSVNKIHFTKEQIAGMLLSG